MYKNDIVFKFIFGRNTYLSMMLRKFLLDSILDIDVQNIITSNPLLPILHPTDKELELDIFMSFKEQIGIEMQNSKLSDYLKLRFQYYVCKNISSQIMGKDENNYSYDYDHLIPYYQIVFIDDKNHLSNQLIEEIQLQYDQGIIFEKNLIHLIFVYLDQIQYIYQTKHILNEFEAMIYLIQYNTLENISYIEKKGILHIMEKLYNEFKGNQIYQTMRLTKKEQDYFKWLQMKLEKEEGIKEGIHQTYMQLLFQKYHQDASWVQNCNQEQINLLSQLIFSHIDYQDLKQRVLAI